MPADEEEVTRAGEEKMAGHFEAQISILGRGLEFQSK